MPEQDFLSAPPVPSHKPFLGCLGSWNRGIWHSPKSAMSRLLISTWLRYAAAYSVTRNRADPEESAVEPSGRWLYGHVGHLGTVISPKSKCAFCVRYVHPFALLNNSTPGCTYVHTAEFSVRMFSIASFWFSGFVTSLLVHTP